MTLADSRGHRYHLLEYLRGVSVRSAAATCMHSAGSTVSIAATAGGVVHVGGVKCCGSPWACPVCSPVIRERRAGEIDQGVAGHLAGGGSAYFVTSTMRHHAGTPLADSLKIVQRSWTQTMRSRSARGGGYVGQIRSIEITHGKHGWHPHIHAVILFDEHTSDTAAMSYLRAMGTRWGDQVRKRGGSVGASGFDIRPVHEHGDGIGSYLCKVQGGWGIGLELARADVKQGRSTTSVKPFEFLARAAAGEAFALTMWSYYERATKGRNAIVWSRGLKARLGVVEVDDTAAAEAELQDEPVVLCVVPAEAWRRLLVAGKASELLDFVGAVGQGLGVEGGPYPPGWFHRLAVISLTTR